VKKERSDNLALFAARDLGVEVLFVDHDEVAIEASGLTMPVLHPTMIDGNITCRYLANLALLTAYVDESPLPPVERDLVPNIRLGINTCFAVKRWPEPSDWARIVAVELGLDAVQLSLDLLPQGFDFAPAANYGLRTRDAVEAQGIELHSLFTGLGAYSSGLLTSDSPSDREAALEWYKGIIALSALAGARGAGGHLGALSIFAASDSIVSAHLRNELKSSMRILADVAADAGLDHLQFENLTVTREYGHSLEEARDLERSMRDSSVPWVLCLDLGHPGALPPETGSADVMDWLTEPWLATPVIQLQQTPAGSDAHGPFTACMNDLGLVKRDLVLDAIEIWDCDEVFLFFEVIPSHEQPIADLLQGLHESVEFWREGIKARARN
jgi:sugar phosphate isomerase/epimerase